MNEKDLILSFLSFIDENYNVELAVDVGWCQSELQRVHNVEFYIDRWLEENNREKEI